LSILHGELTAQVIGAAIEVHRHLGLGLLESVYERCLAYELDLRAIPARRQVPVPLNYKDMSLDAEYRIDLLVDDAVIVEVKAVERILPVHEAQLISYLRLMQRQVGLLINFHEAVLKDGVVRRVLSK